MARFRSILFLLYLIVFTAPYSIICVLSCPLPPHWRYRVTKTWAVVTLWVIRHLLGIRYRVIGAENLPAGMAIILSKHQSAWETIAFQQIFPPQSYVFKRELLWIPCFGWGLAQMPHISINRGARLNALSQVVEQGCARLRQGFWVVLFPEGTRVAPGTKGRYLPGGARLGKTAKVPIVPVAHNAGEFWRRNAFVKYPGEIVVSIGKVIDPESLTTKEISLQAEDWIEAEMRRLFPHHYADKVGPNA